MSQLAALLNIDRTSIFLLVMAAVRNCKNMLRVFTQEHDCALMFRVMWHFSDAASEPTADIEHTVTLLTPIKEQFPMFSDNDFYQLCGIVVCHVSGGLEVPFVSERDVKDLFFNLLDIVSNMEQEKGKSGRMVKRLTQKLRTIKDKLKRESVISKRKHQSDLVASIGPKIDAAIHCILFAPRIYAGKKNHIRILATYMRAAVVEAGSVIHVHADPLAGSSINVMATKKGFYPIIH